MDKKGISGITIFVIIWLILVLIVFAFFFDILAKKKVRKESCNQLGMEYFYQDSTEYCLDKNNQAHYVKIECNKLGFRQYACNPRLISIGDVRILGA